MQNNFWIKDQTRQEIITKTQIPNKSNFLIYANYCNFMDAKGLGLKLSSGLDIEVEKLFRKNGFEYIVLDISGKNELFILPNENIVEYTNRIASKVNVCKTEKELLNLLVDEL